MEWDNGEEMGKYITAFCSIWQKMHIKVFAIEGKGQYSFAPSSYASYYASEEQSEILFTNSIEDNQTITIAWDSFDASLDLNVDLYYANMTQIPSTNVNATAQSFSFYCEFAGDLIIKISRVSGVGVFTYSVSKEAGNIFA